MSATSRTPRSRRHAQPATTLRLPWPPSLNSIWRAVGGRILLSADGRRYRAAAIEAAAEQGAAGLALSGRLSVTLDLYPPDRRARDLDNHIKAASDSLTHARVWLDDSQVDELIIRRHSTAPGGLAVITITQIEPEVSK